MFRSLLFLLLCLVGSLQAQGAIIYDIFVRTSFGDSGVLDVGVLEPIEGDVILRETVTDGDASPLAASNLNFFRINVGTSGTAENLQFLRTNGDGGIVIGADFNTLGYAAFGEFLDHPAKLQSRWVSAYRKSDWDL